MSSRLLKACLVSLSLWACSALPAQTSAGAPSADPQPYRLQTGTRLVLTDITVLDKSGNPVHGLGRSAFQVFDDGRPQVIASFEEHKGEVASGPSGTPTQAPQFSNNYLLPPPAVSNILLLDTTNVEVTDQMYLRLKLEQFVQGLTAGQSLAIYARFGEYLINQQDFTSNHRLLLAAINRTVPRLPDTNAQYVTEISTLQQLMRQLGDLPGRKNVVWFSGGSNLFLRADASSMPTGVDLRPLYDQLDAERIALYPIDARGLIVASDYAMPMQHLRMDDMAEATGGRAAYNRNDLDRVASRVVSSDQSFYTLTYAPHDLRLDNTWHKVKVELAEGHYTLAYRRGYYDDGANLNPAAKTSRTLLQANGQTTQLPAEAREPIVFRVEIKPLQAGAENTVGLTANVAPPMPVKKGTQGYVLHYFLPPEAFAQQNGSVPNKVSIGTGVLAINEFGRPMKGLTQQIDMHFDRERWKMNPNGTLQFDQMLELPKGSTYLSVLVWDVFTRRLGTVNLPLAAAKSVAQEQGSPAR